ncbi:restriction endonuclease subunit S [Acidovorax sp. FJL06]|uniref:restriction endonuclease subunit S n=1 Tax=Acidovorax sp. FJL06 TaxID=2153365 RepID=UPI0013157648|nr:restriction endonuclease subunit S [Acidovorax sp. FJL06]
MSEVLDIAALNLSALPNGWHYQAVSEIGATGEQPVLTGPFGTNLGRGDFVASGVPLLTIGCLTQGGINLDKALFVSEEKAKELSRYRLKEGDLLFSRMASVGRAGLVPKWLEGALFNYHIMRLRLDESRIDTRLFINYVRGAKQVRDYLKAVNHGATRDGINTEQLLGLPVAVPPLSEQREIVAELEKQFSRLDEAVANLQRVKANLKRYKASVLKAAVEGRLVETEATLARREGRTFETGEQLLQRILEERQAKWAGRGKYKLPVSPLNDGLPPLPDGWTWATSDQLTYLITSGSRGWGDFYSDTGVLFIRAQDIKTDALNFPDAARVNVPIDAEGTRSSVTEGDILVTITGANVTKSALVPALGELAFVSQHVALMKLSMPETASFVFNWIISPANGRKTLESWAYGAGKPGLSLEQVRALPIALPPLAEQARIVAEVDRHLSIIREVEAEVDTNLQRAKSLRQATLARAFL